MQKGNDSSNYSKLNLGRNIFLMLYKDLQYICKSFIYKVYLRGEGSL